MSWLEGSPEEAVELLAKTAAYRRVLGPEKRAEGMMDSIAQFGRDTWANPAARNAIIGGGVGAGLGVLGNLRKPEEERQTGRHALMGALTGAAVGGGATLLHDNLQQFKAPLQDPAIEKPIEFDVGKNRVRIPAGTQLSPAQIKALQNSGYIPQPPGAAGEPGWGEWALDNTVKRAPFSSGALGLGTFDAVASGIPSPSETHHPEYLRAEINRANSQAGKPIEAPKVTYSGGIKDDVTYLREKLRNVRPETAGIERALAGINDKLQVAQTGGGPPLLSSSALGNNVPSDAITELAGVHARNPERLHQALHSGQGFRTQAPAASGGHHFTDEVLRAAMGAGDATDKPHWFRRFSRGLKDTPFGFKTPGGAGKLLSRRALYPGAVLADVLLHRYASPQDPDLAEILKKYTVPQQ